MASGVGGGTGSMPGEDGGVAPNAAIAWISEAFVAAASGETSPYRDSIFVTSVASSVVFAGPSSGNMTELGSELSPSPRA